VSPLPNEPAPRMVPPNAAHDARVHDDRVVHAHRALAREVDEHGERLELRRQSVERFVVNGFRRSPVGHAHSYSTSKEFAP
jgi:hypothetical protein